MELVPGDLYNIFDRGKRGNNAQLLNIFGTETTGLLSKSKREVTAIFTEGSVGDRYNKNQAGNIQQDEAVLQVTRNPLPCILRGPTGALTSARCSWNATPIT